jgi:hypothetical protein
MAASGAWLVWVRIASAQNNDLFNQERFDDADMPHSKRGILAMYRHTHHAATSHSSSTALHADRVLVAAACAAVCGWAVSLAWLWMA